MNEFSEEEILKAFFVLNSMNPNLRNEKICELTTEQQNKYNKLLDRFIEVNGIDENASACPRDIKAIKGKALEDVASYILHISGDLFEIHRNLRTCTNEIDQLMKLTPKGNWLCGNGLIDKRYTSFIGECKNYDSSISVTYVGKFCSLLLSNQVKLGILFSYHGVTGNGWSYGAGLIKKFYLHKEELVNRFCIIDFNINDFEAIRKGNNLLQIIDDKMRSLQFDTDYSNYISKHPAEL